MMTKQILTEIVDKLRNKGLLDDLYVGNSLIPSAYFIFNSRPFTISLTDELGRSGSYTTISVIVEIDGVTQLIGCYEKDEVDKVIYRIVNF